MTTEMHYLIWATVLGLVHVLATGMFTTLQHGAAYGLSSREEKKEVTGMGGRVQRAFANYMQTFPFFTVAVVVTHLLNLHSSLTVLGAALFFWSRLAFVFLYAFNVIVVRTLAYMGAIAGIVLILVGVF